MEPGRETASLNNDRKYGRVGRFQAGKQMHLGLNTDSNS